MTFTALGKLGLDMAHHELARQFEKHGFCYICFAVDEATYTKHNIGDAFRGGVVIDGVGDDQADINNMLLVVRYGHPKTDRPEPNRWQDRKDAGL